MSKKFIPTAQFPTVATWIAEKRRLGEFVDRSVKKSVSQASFSQPVRMYARPQLAAPRRAAPLPHISEILAALDATKKVAQTLPLSLERKDSFEDLGEETKQVVLAAGVEPIPSPLKTIMGVLGMRGNSGRPMHARFKLVTGSQVMSNSANAKYIQFLYGAGPSFTFSQISAAGEFSSLDQLFDEFFIHSVKVKYIPRNKFAGQYIGAVATTPVNVESCAATIFYLPHNAATFADSSALWYTAQNTFHSKLVDLGSPWTFNMPNPERFDLRGPLGDQTTAQSTMSWCQFSASAKYGGFASIVTPLPTAAAASQTAFVVNGTWGDAIYTFDVSVRARS